jgi:hypothetical protein
MKNYIKQLLTEVTNKQNHHYPKDMIDIIILGSMKDLVKDKNAYFSFLVAPIAITFLGKCISKSKTFSASEDEKKDFDLCINKLMPKYKDAKLYDRLRVSMLAMMRPKDGLGFTHKTEAKEMNIKHMDKNSDGDYILVMEDFWSDIFKAAKEVKNMEFGDKDKMNKPFIDIP